MINQDQFFREATLRICGHLDIEMALFECLKYLKQTFPADAAQLAVWESELKSLRVIALANDSGGKKTDILIAMPPGAAASVDQLQREFSASNWRDSDIINDSSAAPGFKEIAEHYYCDACSLLHLILETIDRPLCSLLIMMPGKDLFNEEHAHTLNLLKQPLSIAMSNALKHREVNNLKDLLLDDKQYLNREIQRMVGDEIIGADFGLKGVMKKARLVATSNSPVLLSGETGVGKDVIANAIHSSSPRRDGPFIAVNCGAIPDSLLDSELFGHEKGAFTGALSQKRGRFERADKGTILLDEIGEMPLEAQVRLLRVLQNREIERIGGTKNISLDIRIIAATNKDLEQEVREGRFREDLFFRINVFPIVVPPLRDRTSDIPALVQHFIERKTRELKIGQVARLADGAIETLMAYRWPGNVRELENIIERAMILYQGEPLRFDELQPGMEPPTAEGSVVRDETPLGLDSMNIQHITRVLEMTDGKIHGPDGAGELLGVNPNTLRTKMKKLGIRFQKG